MPFVWRVSASLTLQKVDRRARGLGHPSAVWARSMRGGSWETSAVETVDQGNESLRADWGERAADAWMGSGMRERGMNW